MDETSIVLSSKIILSYKSYFFVFTDSNNNPSTLSSCSKLVLHQSTGIQTIFEKDENNNDKKFTFICRGNNYPDLRVQIWNQGTKNCLGVGDFRRKVADDWEYIQGFVFHPTDMSIFFENTKLPIVSKIRMFSRNTDLLYSLRVVEETAKERLPIPFRRQILEGFQMEVQNWLQQNSWLKTDQQEDIRIALSESIQQLKYDYHLENNSSRELNAMLAARQ